MIAAAFALIAAQAAPAAAPNPEAMVRKALAARGMSAAGIDASFVVQHRHEPALRAIVQRGRAAEAALKTALTKRPVDIAGFAAANGARADAAAAFQRESAGMATEQLRVLSPADRVIVAQVMVARPPAKP